MLARFFRFHSDPFYVVRCRIVGEVVARALGVDWSPRVTTIVAAVLEAQGVRRVSHNHRYLYKNLIPCNLTEEEAWKQSAALRNKALTKP